MSVLDKVVWAEGVFLGQQHFQVWERYQASRLFFMQKSMSPFYWGLVDMRWNESALREGRLEMRRLAAVLPDGRFIDYSNAQDGSLSLDLAAISAEEFTVVLTVPSSDLVQGVAGYQSDGKVGGWVADFTEVADDHDASRKREVMTAKVNLQLRTESEIVDESSTLRLMRVQKQFDGEYKILADLLPASLTVSASVPLYEMYRTCVDMLSNVVRDFAKARESTNDVANYSATELSDFLLQKELACLYVDFNEGGHYGKVHPFDFYKTLCKLHQVCATFLAPKHIGVLPEYDHISLQSSLPILLDEVRSMLSLKKQRPESGVELTRLSSGRYESSTIPRHTLESFSFYLAVDAKRETVDWVNQFVHMCKVAAPDQLEMLSASGLAGVPIRHAQRVPQKIRIKSGFEYFKITTDSEMWANVIQAQSFGVFCLGEFSDCEMDLIMVDES